MKRILLTLAACLLAAAQAQAADLKPLRAADVDAVLAGSQGKPQIVEIWSLDCSYCRENTARIVEWQKKHRGVRLTMIAMDPIDDNAQALSQVLATLPLAPQTALYANAEAIPEKLRRALDPNWHGEMPRTLLIDAHGARQASSGLLQPAALDAWLR
ncbi:TlpA family protein disulfide reductase [Burkholderia sp. Ac-20365]|uniref:TlpA family protein disulfide reductase n=1 Tax=Burkholderia sp. Ac-20365 TaxID=2703897 RepID=UPI00197C87E9|nr:TlpA family protein disulfide reductase [Burkholderia sp. Ac-20365]MBN3766732.1 TlpA family protein disulfide reductase [Burkholderia sp. Ac-20365]